MAVIDEKAIELSKFKLFMLFIGAGVFVFIGAWMFTLNPAEILARHRFNDPIFVHGLGLLCMLAFGLALIFGIKKFFDSRPGLVLTNLGITDNSSGASTGFIPWNEISGFGMYEINKQKMVTVLLKDPEKYIEVGNTLKRKLNRVNYKLCGSPISISANALVISFDELVRVCDEYFRKYADSAS